MTLLHGRRINHKGSVSDHLGSRPAPKAGTLEKKKASPSETPAGGVHTFSGRGQPMARKGRSRIRAMKSGKSVPAGALAAQDMASAAITGTADDGMWLVSADLTVALEAHTAGEGPLVVGCAKADYTAAEIEEWYESNASWDRGDMIANEHARRKCRMIGTFNGLTTEEVLNNGVPIRIKLGWKLEPGEVGIQYWIFNDSAATLTTGTLAKFQGFVYGRPTG